MKLSKEIKNEIKLAMKDQLVPKWKVVYEWDGYTLVLHDTAIFTGIPSKEEAIRVSENLDWFIRTSRDI